MAEDSKNGADRRPDTDPAVEAGQPAGGGHHAATKAGEVGKGDHAIVAAYFADNGSTVLRAHQRWRTATLLARLITIALGLLLIGVPTINAWLHHGGLSAAFLEDLSGRSELLIPAVPLVIVGMMPWIWRFGWELPAGLLLAIFAIEMVILQPHRPRMTLALIVFALAAIAYGAYLRAIRWRAPSDIKAIEEEVDGAIERLLQKAIAEALETAPFPIDNRRETWRVLKTLADQHRLPGIKVQSIVGHHKRLRISPLGFAAFNLRDDAMLAVLGAVDLTRDHVLFANAQELAYSEIQGLEWTKAMPVGEARLAPETKSRDGDAAKGASGDEPAGASMLDGIRSSIRRGVGKRVANEVTIDLPRDRQIRLVFQDSGLVEQKAGGRAIEDILKIRSVCGTISERRRLALAGAHGRG